MFFKVLKFSWNFINILGNVWFVTWLAQILYGWNMMEYDGLMEYTCNNSDADT